MNDPKWYDQLPRWARHVVDQLLHFAAGAAISGLVGGVASVWLEGVRAGLIGAAASTLAAAIRELVQNLGDRDNDVLDSILDWAAWSAGGLCVGAILWGCA